MNILEYINTVSGLVHEGLEAWARDLLRDAGVETTEVYGSFPPEGTIASHIVLFPYRVGSDETTLTAPEQETTLLGPRLGQLSRKSGIPGEWLDIAGAISEMLTERFPRMALSGKNKNRPHPAPLVADLPAPIRDWYTDKEKWTRQGREGVEAVIPSLTWKSPIALRMQYLIVVGEGARGTGEGATNAPLAIQTLSVLTAGMQLRRRIVIEVPPAPFDREVLPYIKATAETMGEPHLGILQEGIGRLESTVPVSVTIIPAEPLSNSDFTSLVQAMQRPLQPMLHFGVQVALGGRPSFEPGISVDPPSGEQKAR